MNICSLRSVYAKVLIMIASYIVNSVQLSILIVILPLLLSPSGIKVHQPLLQTFMHVRSTFFLSLLSYSYIRSYVNSVFATSCTRATT